MPVNTLLLALHFLVEIAVWQIVRSAFTVQQASQTKEIVFILLERKI